MTSSCPAHTRTARVNYFRDDNQPAILLRQRDCHHFLTLRIVGWSADLHSEQSLFTNYLETLVTTPVLAGRSWNDCIAVIIDNRLSTSTDRSLGQPLQS